MNEALIEAYESDLSLRPEVGDDPEFLNADSFCCIDDNLTKEEIRLREKRRIWQAARAVLKPMVDELEPLATSIGLDDYLCVNVAGDKQTLLRVLRIIRRGGFKSISAPPQPGDTQWCSFFQSPAFPRNLWFVFTSTVCRQVEIGVEMVPKKIYKTVCGEGDLQLDEPAPKELTHEPSLD